MQKAIYGKIKEIRQTCGEWLTGANTQNIPYFSIVATKYKTRQRRVRRLLMRIQARRCVVMMGKEHINDG